MKRVGLKKKVILPIMLVLTGSVLTVALVVYNSLTGVKADAVFDGITNVINNKTQADETFNIVEVVPDKSMAAFGYLIDGQEPDLGLSGLSTIYNDKGNGPKLREDYIKSVKEKLSSIVDETEEADTKPLYYNGYEESYVNPDENEDGSVKEDSEWSRIDLAGEDVIPAGTKGYTMEDVGEGNGDYMLGKSFALSVSSDGLPTGDYNQNIDHYLSLENGQGGYYLLAFKKADIAVGMSATEYFSQKDENGEYINKAYKVKSFSLISGNGKCTDVQAIAGSEPDKIVYYSNDGGATYHYMGKAKDYYNNSPSWNKLPDGWWNFTFAEFDFEYVSVDNIADDDTYYVVDDDNSSFCADKTGNYSAVLDDEQPYLSVDTNSSDTSGLGYFTLADNGDKYGYVGKGNGSYALKKDSAQTLDKDLLVNKLYVRNPLINRDWFRKYVFGNDSDIKFNVRTVTPGELNNISLPSIDLLYISCVGLDGEEGKKFTTGDDITEENANKILNLIRDDNSRLPVIADSGIVDKIENYYWGTPNISKLAAILCSSNNTTTTTIGNIQLTSVNNVNTVLKYDYSTYKNGVVSNNVYSLPTIGADDIPYILGSFTEIFGNTTGDQSNRVFKDAANSIGCGEIAEYINEQNALRKNENKELLKKQITRGTILSYIISYADKEEIQTKPLESLNVLTIQPRAITGAENGNWEEAIRTKVMAMLGSNSPEKGKIYITRYSMAEFIGKIDDLSKYDMIYMGLSTNNYNLDWNTRSFTAYNDSAMNGLIYSNIGDVIPVSPYTNGFSGLLDSDYNNSDRNSGLNTSMTKYDQTGYATAVNTYRTSGNDITENKIRDLKKYLDGGYPIVFDNGFFDYNSESKINETVIDNSSNLYSFLKDIYDLDNIVELDKAGNAYNLYNLLNHGKPKLDVTAPQNAKEQAYSESSDGKLSIEFTVGNTLKDNADDAVDVELYIDTNLDGKFSETTEKISMDAYSLYRNGELVKETIIDNSTKTVINEGADKYKLVYDLPTGYIGLINWKLVVKEDGNDYRYDYETGYVHMAAADGQKIKVKILQICSPDEPYVSNLEMVTNRDLEKWQKEHGNEKAPWFNSYMDENVEELREKGDYDLNFTTYASNDETLINICKNKKLGDYDMIVLGFADDYELDNSNGVVDAVREYIENGKPVIITKNVFTSCNYFNGNSSQSRGYDVNKILRDVVGMDRYGVLNSKSLISGKELTDTSTEYSDVLTYAQANSTDIPYEPGSGKSKIVRQSQGYTYINLERNRSSENVYYRTYRDDNQNSQQSNSYWQEKTGIYNDTHELNRGQISVYPYNLTKLDGKLRTADVDPAPYQIDMNEDADGDGETDLVVWFTLYSWGNPNLEMGHSENDARNNYYLYTMRNVTYCGIGSSGANGYTAADEADLFINTIVTTYGTAAHGPALLLKEKYDRNSADVNVMYSSIDSAIDQANAEGAGLDENSTQDAYFTVTDNNRILNQVKSDTVEHVSFYVEGGTASDNDETIVDGNNNTIYLKKVNWDIYSLDANGGESDLLNNSAENGGNVRDYFSNDVTYKIKVPMSVIPDGKNAIKVYAVAYSDLFRLKKDGTKEKVETPKVYKTFNVQRIGLADLD